MCHEVFGPYSSASIPPGLVTAGNSKVWDSQHPKAARSQAGVPELMKHKFIRVGVEKKLFGH